MALPTADQPSACASRSRRDQSGAGSAPACWFDVLVRAGSRGGLPGPVEEQLMASLGLLAPRPASSALPSASLEHIVIEPLRGLAVAVGEWLHLAAAEATA